MSISNCCFLACIQVSQEAGQVVRYAHLFQNFPQFIVIHTVKGFGIVNKAEVDVFLELSCFFDDPADIGKWSLVPLSFLKPAWTSGSSRFTYCWSLAWRILSITLLAWHKGMYISFSSFDYYWITDWYSMLYNAMLCYILLYYGRKFILKIKRILVAISFQTSINMITTL